MSRYTYSRRSPLTTRIEFEEHKYPLGHRMGVVVRRDKLTPGAEGLSYQPFCTCGWPKKGTEDRKRWYRPKSGAKKVWIWSHIRQVENQGTLDINGETSSDIRD